MKLQGHFSFYAVAKLAQIKLGCIWPGIVGRHNGNGRGDREGYHVVGSVDLAVGLSLTRSSSCAC